MTEVDAAATRVLGLLRDSLYAEPSRLDEDLIDSGVVNSAAFMELFLLLEEEFGIEIEAEDLDLEHFRTVERIAAFAVAKQRRSA